MAGVKKRYANALCELSEERGNFEKDLEEASLIRNNLRDKEVQAFLAHPHIRNSDKEELFQKSFSNKISDDFMGFLYLMVRKNRESLIVPVLDEYIVRTNKKLGRIEARVVSAKELTKEQIESIRVTLTKQTDMEIEINAIVDPDVLGGFYILVDGRVFDGTVRSRMNKMREHLKRGSYE